MPSLTVDRHNLATKGPADLSNGSKREVILDQGENEYVKAALSQPVWKVCGNPA